MSGQFAVEARSAITTVPAQVLQRKCACGGTPGPDGECAACQQKRLQRERQSTETAGREAIPSIVHDVLRSPGQALDQATRSAMEPRFGHDFSQVRVHTDSHAAESARAVNALAYTVGRHVVFAEGRFNPRGTAGQHLLAHELTHVIQQGSGTTHGDAMPTSIAPQDSAEHEAMRVGASASREGSTPVTQRAGTSLMQRFLSTEPAGGCGICYGTPRNAGRVAHIIVQTEFEILNPFGLVELPVTSAADENGRLDLAIATPSGFEIGEIKPANENGYAQGIQDIAFYVGALTAMFPTRTIRPLTRLLPPAIFPNPLAPPCQQTIFVNPPVGGVYGYYCTPPFSQLVRDPKCRCRQVPPPVPKKQEQKQEKESPERSRSRRSESLGEPIPAATALLPAAAVTAIAALLARQALKRAGGPATAAASLLAAITLLATTDAKASVGLSGEDPLETLFRSMEEHGTPAPPALRQLIENDPVLKQRMQQALKSGDLTAAQKELNRDLLRLVDQNIDQFSREELDLLLMGAESVEAGTPETALTVERIKKALATPPGGASKNPPGSAAGSGPSAGPKRADTASPPKGSGRSAEMDQRLSRATIPTKRLYQAITARTSAGPVVSTEALQRFLDIVEPAALTNEQVDRVLASLRPVTVATIDDILGDLQTTIDQVKGRQSATPSASDRQSGGAQGSGSDQQSRIEPAPTSSVGPATAPQTAPEKGPATDSAGSEIARSLAGFANLRPGEHRMNFKGPFKVGETTSGFVGRRLDTGTLIGGWIRLTPLENKDGNLWRVRILGGNRFYDATGRLHSLWPNQSIVSEVTVLGHQ